jgi:hypothetical protein
MLFAGFTVPGPKVVSVEGVLEELELVEVEDEEMAP